MMLMHVTSLGALRQELIESLGKNGARPDHPDRLPGRRARRRDGQEAAIIGSTFRSLSRRAAARVARRDRPLRAARARYRRRQRPLLRRFRSDRLRRGGGASRQLQRRRRAGLLDAGRLRLRLHLHLHGPPDLVARDRMPRHGPRPLPRRGPAGRGVGRGRRRRPAVSADRRFRQMASAPAARTRPQRLAARPAGGKRTPSAWSAYRAASTPSATW